MIWVSEGKIRRKPLRTGTTSSFPIVYGAFDSTRRKTLQVRSEGKLSRRGSADTASRSSRIFAVLKWICRTSKSLQCAERETREAVVVWHELAKHTVPNEASLKRGSAVAISAILLSVKLKAHPLVTEQADDNLRKTNSWNSIMGDMKAVSMAVVKTPKRVIL